MSGAQVKLETASDGLVVIAPPQAERDPIATAIILTLDKPAMSIPPLTVMKGGELAIAAATTSNIFQSDAEYGPAKAVDRDADTRWATDAGC